ncbi:MULTISPECIES: HNH endonuclease family protein [Corynebacterium]|uniref:HNH endonuclease family protein n=1 Tax=Corynebacterium TaxID=1716 RepID=UPI0019588C8A|nr:MULTISPECIES: HNH endonuclease family protein [Corynebacterium]MDN8623800.1 HNH endonuclease family protein [Corynebacterium kroppenstedtii]QRQ64372.1 HNH endonuclease [Corynebacterium kroppenstedtii]
MTMFLVVAIVALGHRPETSERRSLDKLLSSARIIDYRTTILGYQRDKFGDGWARSPTPEGTWCTTRQHVLREQLDDIKTADTCDVVRGHGLDPYTGKKLTIGSINIDHIVPLAAAWDLGAARWSREERMSFANDRKRNLVVTDSHVNRKKSDKTPEEWMPPSAEQACWYATTYAKVIVAYDLALTKRDASALRDAC